MLVLTEPRGEHEMMHVIATSYYLPYVLLAPKGACVLIPLDWLQAYARGLMWFCIKFFFFYKDFGINELKGPVKKKRLMCEYLITYVICLMVFVR